MVYLYLRQLMKNIITFAVFITLWNCAQYAYTQENKSGSYALSICPQFGFFYGQAEEIVYPPSRYKAKYLSQLLWDIKPVFYYGIALDFSRAQPMTKWGFFSNITLKNGIPGKSGSMEDRDWESIENDGLTKYSKSDNFTENLFFLDFSAGFSFPLKHSLLIKTFISFSYMNLSFYGENGYGTYARETGGDGSGIFAPINDSPDYISFANRGKLITYTQEWYIGSIGVSLSYYFNARFYAEVAFRISPLVFCNDWDKHLQTGTQYRDYMRGGIFLEPGLQFFYSIGRRLELSLKCSWRYIDGTKGEIYEGSLSGGYFTRNGNAGAGVSIIDTGLCLRLRL